MIDKVWYDWQHRDKKNKNAFGGGSVSWQVDPSLSLSQYPTGGPPWLNVRGKPFSQFAIGMMTLNVQQKSSVIPSDGLWKDTTVKDVMGTVGRRLCYVYE